MLGGASAHQFSSCHPAAIPATTRQGCPTAGVYAPGLPGPPRGCLVLGGRSRAGSRQNPGWICVLATICCDSYPPQQEDIRACRLQGSIQHHGAAPPARRPAAFAKWRHAQPACGTGSLRTGVAGVAAGMQLQQRAQASAGGRGAAAAVAAATTTRRAAAPAGRRGGQAQEPRAPALPREPGGAQRSAHGCRRSECLQNN